MFLAAGEEANAYFFDVFIITNSYSQKCEVYNLRCYLVIAMDAKDNFPSANDVLPRFL